MAMNKLEILMVSLKKSSQESHVGDGIKNLLAFSLSSLGVGFKPVSLQVLNVDKTLRPERIGPHEKKFSSFFLLFSNWSISGLINMH
jgi:hypothetical protein